MVSRLATRPVLKRILTVALVAGVFSLSALGVMYASLRGRTVKVPDVVRMGEAQAQDELADSGLIMQVKSRTHHPQIPAQAVCDQSPAAGTTVKTGQLVRVTLSLGAPPESPAKN